MKSFKQLEFDLLYLGLLTKEEIKPLSRWEKEFGAKEIKSLKELGLKTAIVERRLTSGKQKDELIFSKDRYLLETYTREFMGKTFEKSPHVIRFEGALFGYPSCCIEQFIKEGYVQNKLDPEDQKILFHWACRDCKVTPLLLPRYRAVYQETLKIISEYSPRNSLLWRIKFIPALAVAGCLTMFTVSCESQNQTDAPEWLLNRTWTPTKEDSIHWLQIPNDQDRDGLADGLEVQFELDSEIADMDEDEVPDGRELGRKLWEEVMALPREKTENKPYVIEYIARGYETCQKCGAWVNMGYVEVINPLKKLSIGVPFIGLHYLECGSFHYQGDLHHGLLDVELLKRILRAQ